MACTMLLVCKAPSTVQGTPVKLPWIFPGAQLKYNGAPGIMQGRLTPLPGHSMHARLLCQLKYVNSMFVWPVQLLSYDMRKGVQSSVATSGLLY